MAHCKLIYSTQKESRQTYHSPASWRSAISTPWASVAVAVDLHGGLGLVGSWLDRTQRRRSLFFGGTIALSQNRASPLQHKLRASASQTFAQPCKHHSPSHQPCPRNSSATFSLTTRPQRHSSSASLARPSFSPCNDACQTPSSNSRRPLHPHSVRLRPQLIAKPLRRNEIPLYMAKKEAEAEAEAREERSKNTRC